METDSIFAPLLAAAAFLKKPMQEVDHGPAFWHALGRVMPDWQERKETMAAKAKDYLIFGLSV